MREHIIITTLSYFILYSSLSSTFLTRIPLGGSSSAPRTTFFLSRHSPNSCREPPQREKKLKRIFPHHTGKTPFECPHTHSSINFHPDTCTFATQTPYSYHYFIPLDAPLLSYYYTKKTPRPTHLLWNIFHFLKHNPPQLLPTHTHTAFTSKKTCFPSSPITTSRTGLRAFQINDRHQMSVRIMCPHM